MLLEAAAQSEYDGLRMPSSKWQSISKNIPAWEFFRVLHTVACWGFASRLYYERFRASQESQPAMLSFTAYLDRFLTVSGPEYLVDYSSVDWVGQGQGNLPYPLKDSKKKQSPTITSAPFTVVICMYIDICIHILYVYIYVDICICISQRKRKQKMRSCYVSRPIGRFLY